MKKILILLFALPLMASAQDTLITTKGEVIACKVSVIAPTYISYSDINGSFTIPIEMVFDKKINGHPFIPTAQSEQNEYNDKLKLAGKELQKAAKTWFAGFVVSIVGGILTGTGVALINKSPEAAKGLYYTGAGISIFGGVTMVASFSNIARAGIHLDAYEPEKH